MNTAVIKQEEKVDEKLQNIRNIGFIAHIDAGKTTTTERVLFYTGKVYKIGEVDEGTTTTDWMVQEKERGITITSAATYCQWKGYNINIIDTPGHVDFTVEVERALKVLDGAVTIFCAVGGVEPQTETVWRQADKYNVSRLAFINKLDRVGADFFAVVKEMEEKLGANTLILQLPLYESEELKGIIDLLNEKAVYYKDVEGLELDYQDIPKVYQEKAALYRDKIIEKIAEIDDEIMEKFIHNQSISLEEIKKKIRKYTTSNKLVPVFCGTALKNKGIQLLLDGICDYLPSPADLDIIQGTNPRTEEITERKISPKEAFCGLCFKVFTDPYVGKLFYVRIYSGTISSGQTILNVAKDKKERINKIVRMHANRQEIIPQASCGDIVCFVGLKDTETGDTLTDIKHPLLLEEIKFPEPVISLAIEPKSKAEQDKLGLSLAKLADEDPSFHVRYNSETGQTIISGMGQLHLEVMVDRLLKEFNVQAKVGRPQVAYKETIKTRAESVGKFVQQTGGHGQYGHVVFVLEPIDSKDHIVFENKIKGGAIPREFIPAVKQGVEEAAKSGVLGGYPVTGVKVTLTDGSSHEVDSSEFSFKMAAEIGFKQGLQKGGPVLLEPIMKAEIITPNEYLSQVIGDLNSRRANIKEISERNKVKIVKAEVPLAEVFNYVDTLRNLTQGRASYAMEPSYYNEVPPNIAAKILGG